MGYYVSLEEADFVIPGDKLDEAMRRFRELNKHDKLKRGGSSTGEKWFSWMNNVDWENSNARNIIENLGFYITESRDDGSISLSGYDSKTGQEELFLAVLAPLVRDGSFIVWRGEDGEVWRNVVVNGYLLYQGGHVVFPTASETPDSALRAQRVWVPDMKELSHE